MIVLEDVSRAYGERLAVAGVSFSVARGECVFLVGASGSGKTTTLKMVNRLIEPSAGRILLDGCDVREGPAHRLRRRVGYAFQGAGLFPHMTVGENVAVTPELLGWPRDRIAARVEALLEMVELPPAEYRDRWPHELSGGQQQRVGLARALAAEPEVLLLDEPFGALDPLTRDRLQESFRALRSALAVTVLFVSHDMAEALLLADRIAVMEAGRILQIGTPQELVAAPADETVAELLATPLRQRDAVQALLGGEP